MRVNVIRGKLSRMAANRKNIMLGTAGHVDHGKEDFPRRPGTRPPLQLLIVN
jgi:hypothetical protein